MTEEQDKNNSDDDFASQTTTGPPEQPQRHQQSVVRIAAAAATIAVPALAALAIVFVFSAGNTEDVFAPPPPPCINCATQIEGSGFGTITVPEDSEIAPAPCAACFASISFNATTLPDTKKHEATGTLTITYTDAEGIEHSISGDITSGEIKEAGNSFKLEGIHPPFCPLCDFVLKGTIQKGTTDTADIVFKAADGTTATFDNAKVTISTIPTET
jgi:hypothetical protein